MRRSSNGRAGEPGRGGAPPRDRSSTDCRLAALTASGGGRPLVEIGLRRATANEPEAARELTFAERSQAMRFVFLVVLTYFALAAQVACGELLNVAGNRMPLLWLPVVWALTWFEDARGIVWAVLVGLLADGLSFGPLVIEIKEPGAASTSIML